jgi:hypothetical protein
MFDFVAVILGYLQFTQSAGQSETMQAVEDNRNASVRHAARRRARNHSAVSVNFGWGIARADPGAHRRMPAATSADSALLYSNFRVPFH